MLILHRKGKKDIQNDENTQYSDNTIDNIAIRTLLYRQQKELCLYEVVYERIHRKTYRERDAAAPF